MKELGIYLDAINNHNYLLNGYKYPCYKCKHLLKGGIWKSG